MTISALILNRSRPVRSFRPSLDDYPMAAHKLEARDVPGTLAFYMNPDYSPGSVQAQAGGTVYGFDPNATTSNVQTAPSNPGASSASASITNGVYGTLGFMGSDGQMHGGQTNCSVTESGTSNVSYSGPVSDPGTSPTATFMFVNTLQTTSTVTTDGQGPYSINGASQQIIGGANASTPSAYHFLIQDASGNPPSSPTATITDNIVINLDAPQQNFFLGASIGLTSAHMDVSLDVGDAGMLPNAPGPGLYIWDPVDGTSLVADPNFTGGNINIVYTVPAFPQETVSYGSSIASYPLGNFNAPTTSQTYNLNWSFKETMTTQ